MRVCVFVCHCLVLCVWLLDCVAVCNSLYFFYESVLICIMSLYLTGYTVGNIVFIIDFLCDIYIGHVCTCICAFTSVRMPVRNSVKEKKTHTCICKSVFTLINM